jgi:tripartite-type tricarboxylate transporter receptor subunit TctC
VPYRGGAPAMADLISGQLPIAILAMTGQFLEFHRAGKVRVLAVTGPTRLRAEREIPTVAEEGFPPLTMGNSIGLFAPAGTPETIIDRVAWASHKALEEPAFQQMLTETGYEPDLDSSPNKFRRSLEEDVAHWAPVVKTLGLKID